MNNSTSSFRVVHCTTAHSRYDIRIFAKECRSLAATGYRVSFVVADGGGDEIKDGVSIHGVMKRGRRLSRMLRSPADVLKKALSLEGEVYHLHDPELLFVGLMLSARGKRVVFDSHEDVPKQILTKPYLNKVIAKIISHTVVILEKMIFRRFSLLIAATNAIDASRHIPGALSVVINNYPFKNELHATKKTGDTSNVSYIGGISSIRGLGQLVDALSLCSYSVRLNMAGPIVPSSYKNDLMKRKGWESVDYHGVLGRDGVKDILASTMAGIVTFLPVPNHIDSQPNKLFEYMSAGLPVIASNFPLWQEIVLGNKCGICVDPEKPEEIAAAIDWIMGHSEEARVMGENGRKAVLKKYNWETESVKLVDAYARLLKA